MKSLKQTYNPTPWLFNGHIHTVYGMRYRKRSIILDFCKRTLFTFSDGGTSALDMFDTPAIPEDAPLVIINPTLGGGTREPVINNLTKHLVIKGFRVVVANARGCSGAPITSARLSCGADYDDIEETLHHLRQSYHPSHVFIVGFSLGALQSLCFSAYSKKLDKDGNDTGLSPVDGIVCVSHLYNNLEGAYQLDKFPQNKLYLKVMLKQLCHIVKKNKFVNYPDIDKCKTLHEFDDVFTAKIRGFESHKEYYKKASAYDKIKLCRAPTLLISADDDPFTQKRFHPVKEVAESTNVALVHTAEGGHVSFVSGFNGQSSLLDFVIPEFFQSIINIDRIGSPKSEEEKADSY